MATGWTDVEGGTIFHIPVQGTDIVEDFDTRKVEDEEDYKYIYWLGAKAALSRGRAKLGAKSSFVGDAEAYAKAAVEIFIQQREAIYNGKLKRTGVGGKTKAKGEEAKLKTEIHRIAFKDGCDLLKNNNYILSHLSTETKNKVAEALIAQDPDKYKRAALASLAAAAGTKADKGLLAVIGFEVKADPKKVAAAEKRKASNKKPQAEVAVPPPAMRPNIRGGLRPGMRPQ
jgi:hypothetical protein